MRTVITMCTMVIGLGIAGFAVSTHGYTAHKAPELVVPAAVEDDGRGMPDRLRYAMQRS